LHPIKNIFLVSFNLLLAVALMPYTAHSETMAFDFLVTTSSRDSMFINIGQPTATINSVTFSFSGKVKRGTYECVYCPNEWDCSADSLAIPFEISFEIISNGSNAYASYDPPRSEINEFIEYDVSNGQIVCNNNCTELFADGTGIIVFNSWLHFYSTDWLCDSLATGGGLVDPGEFLVNDNSIEIVIDYETATPNSSGNWGDIKSKFR
jgi:hypothetical protein